MKRKWNSAWLGDEEAEVRRDAMLYVTDQMPPGMLEDFIQEYLIPVVKP